MALQLRGGHTSGFGKALLTSAAVLALTAQPFSGAVLNGQLSQQASAAAVQNGYTWEVSNAADFQAALNDPAVNHITLTADIDASAGPSLLLTRSNVTINGNDKTLIAPNLGGVWVSNGNNYGLKIYQASNITINSLKVRGGNAAILVNGSSVKLTGNTHVSDNTFGGIEVSRGGGVAANSQLTLQGVLWDEQHKESATRPAVWVVDGQGSVDVSGLHSSYTLSLATHVKPGQTQYYVHQENSGTVATNVTQSKTYATLTGAVTAANANDVIELNQDIITPNMVTIDKPLTIDGKGKTVTASYSFTTNGVDNAVFTITANNVTLKNLTTTNTSTGAKPHGVVVQQVTGAKLDTVTLRNGRAGLIVNSSNVEVNNITTSGNSWYGINVDNKYAPAKLTVLGVSNHEEASHIAIDDRAMTTATVSDPNLQYVRYWAGAGYSYVLDRAAPTVSLSVAAYNPTSFDVAAADDHSVTRIDYSIWEDGNTRQIGVWGNNINLQPTYNQTVTQYCERVPDGTTTKCVWHPFSDLAEGEYTLRATVKDVRGKVTNATSQNFIIDKTALTVTANDIAVIVVGQKAIVTGTVNKQNITSIKASVTVNGTLYEADGTLIGQDFGFEIEDLPVGQHNVVITVKDAAGNEVQITKVAKVNAGTSPTVVTDATSSNSDGEVPANLAEEAAPQIFIAPIVALGDNDVLGQQDTTASQPMQANVSDQSGEEVKGATDEKDGTFSPLGFAWYWWLVALAAIAGLWWLLAALRKRGNEEE